MIDQLIIGKKSSYDDFEASVKERKDNPPKKKKVKDTVPFSNETFDFSGINGEVYWEERTLEYTFEILATSPEELEEKKQAFVSWVMNVIGEELHDPYVLNYHYLATFDDISVDDSEVEKSTITVTFTAYPYKIANDKKTFTFNLTEEETTAYIRNDSSHRITPTFKSEVPFSMRIGNKTYSVPAGETTSYTVWLDPDVNKVFLQSVQGSGTLKIEFSEEVF